MYVECMQKTNKIGSSVLVKKFSVNTIREKKINRIIFLFIQLVVSANTVGQSINKCSRSNCFYIFS